MVCTSRGGDDLSLYDAVTGHILQRNVVLSALRTFSARRAMGKLGNETKLLSETPEM